jgi:Zn finger protein HypA/HybF involved in hydrogenase expression
MTMIQSKQLPAAQCPHCAGAFEPAETVTHCPDCGYIPGKGAD